MRDLVLKPSTGDLDAMVKRRLVRIGVTFNRTFYFLDKGVQRGISYEYGQLVEERLNKHFKTGIDDKIHVVFLPLPRSQLLPALVDGKVDLVAAQVTVTARRSRSSSTSPIPPGRTSARLSSPAAGQPPLASVADLSGREVFVREKSDVPREPPRAQRDVQGARASRRWRFASRRRTSKTTTCSRW